MQPLTGEEFSQPVNTYDYAKVDIWAIGFWGNTAQDTFLMLGISPIRAFLQKPEAQKCLLTAQNKKKKRV